MLSIRKLVAVCAPLVFAASGIALAEAPLKGHPMKPEHMQEMPMGDHAGIHAALATPTMPGQDAFGAIQEIVQILDADPKTDWSKVDLEVRVSILLICTRSPLKPALLQNRSTAVWKLPSPATAAY